MKKLKIYSFLFILLSIYSCQEDEITEDLTPNLNTIIVETSSSILPLNEYGKAIFQSKDEWGQYRTDETDFFVNNEKIEGNIFTPNVIGEYKVKASYKDLISEEIIIQVEEALNKKLLIEYFTSRTCGWCPWIGSRVDSLSSNKSIIGYSIHGQDQLEIEGIEELQEYQFVNSRPAVRLNRGYVRNFDTPIEVEELIDSIRYLLSFQAKAELAINSNINLNQINAEIFAKFHSISSDSLFLTFILVEDNIIIQNQSNFFSGSSLTNCPYVFEPNPIPEYTTHNVVRKFITNSTGQKIEINVSNNEEALSIGEFQFEISNSIEIQNASLIAILHSKRNSIDLSSVINSQVVKLGENINFKE